MKKQRDHQKKFLTFAFGGPNSYNGRNMRDAHSKFKLNHDHFNAIISHLAATLKELGVDDETIKEVAGVAETTRTDILNL